MSRHHKTFAPRTSWFEAQTLDNEEAEKKYAEISSQDATISLAKNEVTQLTHDLFNNRAFNKIEKNQSVLQFSNEGLHVQTLNKALNELGYKTKKNETLFWNETKSQLINFQRDHGVKASGILDAKTLLKMDEVLVKWGDSKDENSYNNEEISLQEKRERKENQIIPASSPPDEKVSISVGVVPMKIKSNQEFFEYLDIQIFGRIIDAQWNIGNNSYKDYIGKETTCEVSISSLKKYLGITDAQWEDMHKNKKTSSKLSPAELRKSVQKQIKKVKDRIKEMQTLSSAKRQFIKDPTSSLDYIQNTRILDLLEQLSDQEIEDYKSKVSQETTDLAIIEASLKAYIAMREKNRKNQEELETVKTKLYGLEEFYKEYRRYVDYLKNSASESSSLSISQGSNSIDLSPIFIIPEWQEKLDKKAIQHGFENLTDFENTIKKYLVAFRNETVRIVENYIDKYEHLLYEEEKRLKQDEIIKQLYIKFSKTGASENIHEGKRKERNALTVINRSGSKEIESQKLRMYYEGEKEKKTAINKIKTLDSPLFKDKAFDFDKLGDVNSQTDFEKVLFSFIESKRENAHIVRQDLKDNPDAIFKQQELLQYSYQQQGIAKNSINDLIIQQEISDIQWTQLLIGIGLAVAAIISMVVTWGASTPYVATVATVSLGISTYSVYEALNQYYKENAAYEIGLLKDKPSLVWVVVAIAGAALDVASLAAVFRAAKPITEAAELFNKSSKSADDIATLQTSLAKIKGLEAKVQVNIVRQAKIQAQEQKILQGFAEVRKLTFVTIPGLVQSGELLARAVFAIRKGIVTFDSFIAELKLAKVIKETGLNPEELLLLKNTFEKAKTLAKDEKLAAELEKAIAENDVAKVKSLLGETDSIPSRLVEGQNIYRGSSKEYSLAKKHLKEYEQGEIYKINKMNIPNEAKIKMIADLQRKNKAYIEGSIENLKFNKSDIRKSGQEYNGEQTFEAYKVDKEGGINTPNAWLRNEDTEYVMLSEIAEQLGAKKGGIYPEIKGEITIVSELPYCISCQGVIQDFSKMFPNEKINLIDNLKY